MPIAPPLRVGTSDTQRQAHFVCTQANANHPGAGRTFDSTPLAQNRRQRLHVMVSLGLGLELQNHAHVLVEGESRCQNVPAGCRKSHAITAATFCSLDRMVKITTTDGVRGSAPYPAIGSNLALLVAGLVASCASTASTGDVFVSYSAEGTPRYASHRLDPSYRLFIPGEVATDGRPAPWRVSAERRHRGKRQLTALIEHYARINDVAPALVAAVASVESGFNAHAVSPKGAMGPMQLMPATAARYGLTDPGNAAQNIEAGVRHLKELLVQYDGNVALALAAYNAGERAVARYGGRIPPYRETMLYVPAVLAAAARGIQQ